MSLDATVVVAARGVDARLMVASGEGLALVGPNGAGKTTLIEALAGLVDLTFADISVDGVEVARTEPPRAQRKGHVLDGTQAWKEFRILTEQSDMPLA